MRDRSRCSPHSAPGRFVVWNRHCPQRLAHQRGCDELLAAWKNRKGVASKKSSVSVSLARRAMTQARGLRYSVSLRHKHGETFAGAAGLNEFGHRQLMAAIAALLQL